MVTLEELTTAPAEGDFTPLSEHQEATPVQFFGARPVLHLHSSGAQLLIAKRELSARPLFAALQAEAETNGADGTVNGTADEQVSLDGVDIWVTSESLTLFSPQTTKGVSIPYPRLSLHALLTIPSTTTQGVYMQLLLTEQPSNTADEDLETLECTLVPSSTTANSTASASAESTETAVTPTTPAQALYAAITACADLHPDPDEDEDGEPSFGGGGMPGEGGWITSENMHEFMDAEGNLNVDVAFAGEGEGEGAGTGEAGGAASLGPGAGAVRAREEEVEEETKWQRTG